MKYQFEDLRNTYKEFIYHSYDINEDNNTITISFHFEIPDFAEFNPKVTIQKKNIKFASIDSDFVKYIAFNLGMVELISYWKCVCPKKVIVKCGYLSKEQIEWFKKLYFLRFRRV